MSTVVLVVFLTILHASFGTKLELVITLYRHGDRAPDSTFPTDSHGESFWPNGWGMLTKKGMRQHYQLGQYLRHRYMRPESDTYLLNKTYSVDQVFIRSTDKDRALMSVESSMASFYKPVKKQMFLKGLNWQPVPVHTVPEFEDVLLLADSVYCPLYDALKLANKNDEDFKQVDEENQDLFKYVEANSGIDYKLDPYNTYDIVDPLYCELQHGLPLPEWCSYKQYHKLRNITGFGFAKMYQGKEINRLTAGVLINHILTNLEKKRNGSEDLAEMKLLVYSAHDTTIGALLTALGVYDGISPPYTSIVLIELFSVEGDYFLKLSYHEGPQAPSKRREPKLLTIPSCTPSCPLDKFARIVKPLRMTEKEFPKECLATLEEMGKF